VGKMKVYSKERIDNAIAFFVHEHYHKTKKPLPQTKLWKYLAYFELDMVKKTGVPPLELEYTAWERGPVPVQLREAIIKKTYIPESVQTIIENKEGKTFITFCPDKKSDYNLDYFSENEIEELFRLIDIFADVFVTADDMSESSHKDFSSWRRAWKKRGNKSSYTMDLSEEFPGDIRTKDESKLKLQEENYLAFESLNRA
jgi:uncharacterized phage-associated protein